MTENLIKRFLPILIFGSGILLSTPHPESWAYNTTPYNFDESNRIGAHVALTKATVQIFLKLLEENPDLVMPPSVVQSFTALQGVERDLSQCPSDLQAAIGCQNSVVWGTIQEDGDLEAVKIVEETARRIRAMNMDIRNERGQVISDPALKGRDLNEVINELEEKSLNELEREMKGREVKGLLRFCNHFFNPEDTSYYPPLCEPASFLSRALSGIFSLPSKLSRLLAHEGLPQWLEGLGPVLLPPKANAIDWANHPENAFSWDNGLKRHRSNTDDGLKILGHTLHLVQDLTVPLHVRGDMHPLHKDYEGLADDFSTRDWLNRTINDTKLRTAIADRIRSQTTPSLALQDRLRELARYTHAYFVSDDTMPSTAFIEKNFLRQDELIVRKLRPEEESYWSVLSEQNPTLDRMYLKVARYNGSNYTVTKDVAENYWEILSVKAIEYGIGVMILFFHETVAQQTSEHR